MNRTEVGLPSLDRVLDFMRSLSRLRHELELTSAEMNARLGITAPQRLIIRVVGRFPGISAGRLAALLCLEPATVSVALRRLEGRGIICREKDPRDRRRTSIALTAKGRAFDVPAAGTVESAAACVLQEADVSEVATALKILEMVSTELARARERDSASRP